MKSPMRYVHAISLVMGIAPFLFAETANGQTAPNPLALYEQKLAREWDALRADRPEMASLFCRQGFTSCVNDWPELRSPLGGWQLFEAGTCNVKLTPCPRLPKTPACPPRSPDLDLTGIPDGGAHNWIPCDVQCSGDTCSCDDICGCTILKSECAGTWDCTSDSCTCSPPAPSN